MIYNLFVKINGIFIFNKNLPWRKIWTNLRINRATRKANQLSWKIIHNTVYTEAKLQKMGRSMNGLSHFCNTQVETLKHLCYDCTVIQQNWVKIISTLKHYMNTLEIKNIDINEITEELIFLGIYEENRKESYVLNTIINMSKFSFWRSRNIIRYQQKLYIPKTLLQLVKSEMIMLIESIPRKSIETRNFVNELNKVVELIK